MWRKASGGLTYLRKDKNLGSEVAELLREWRTTHVRPAKAEVRILTPDK